jgi:hypothetical protein
VGNTDPTPKQLKKVFHIRSSDVRAALEQWLLIRLPSYLLLMSGRVLPSIDSSCPTLPPSPLDG